jgi:hypothetical protein
LDLRSQENRFLIDVARYFFTDFESLLANGNKRFSISLFLRSLDRTKKKAKSRRPEILLLL